MAESETGRDATGANVADDTAETDTHEPDAQETPSVGLALHPRHGLSEALQTPIRFSIMAALDGAAMVEFGVLRDVLDASDSALSKALTLLAQLGFVSLRKGYVGTRPRTWVRAVEAGRHAYREHVAALRAIVELGAGALDPAAAPAEPAGEDPAAHPAAPQHPQPPTSSRRPTTPRGRTA